MSKKGDKALILPAGFELNGAYAVQRLFADPNHKEAVEFILSSICGTYRDTFDSDPRIEGRLQGRRSVGLDLVTIYKLELSKIKDAMEKK